MNLVPSFLAFLNLPTLAEFDVSGRVFGLIMALAGMGFGLTMAVMGMRHEAEKRRQRNELIRLALEKGQPVPPEVMGERCDDDSITTYDPSRGIRNARRAGVILILVSGAMFLFFRGMGLGQVVWVAVFPLAVGIAQLVNAQLDSNERQRAPRPTSPPTDPKSGSTP